MKNIMFVILIIIVIGLGGYIGYDYFINKDNKDSNGKYVEVHEPVKEEYVEDQESVINSCSLEQISDTGSNMLVTDYGLFVYNQNALFLSFSDKVVDPKKILGSKSFYNTGMVISEDGSTNMECYKLYMKDVRSIYSFPVGQADFKALVIIYKDGTVDVLTVNDEEQSSQIIIENYETNYNGISNAIAAYKKDSLGASGFDFIFMNK